MPDTRKLIWKLQGSDENGAGVLYGEGAHGRKYYVEDPRAPDREALEALSSRAGDISVLVIPICSESTITGIIRLMPAVKKIFVVDENSDRLKVWASGFNSRPSRVEVLVLPENEEEAVTVLRENLFRYSGDLMLGRGGVYVPRRFKRLERSFGVFLERAVLRLQQEACSAAAFKTTRSWHLQMNRIVNLKRGRCSVVEPGTFFGTAVIVGAGPSLNSNIDVLKEYRHKAFIISCDSSLNALLESGITPDMVVSSEDMQVSWRFFAKHPERLGHIPLVMPLAGNHTLAAHYPGDVIFTGGPDMPGIFSPLKKALPEVDTGQCVGHYAMLLAFYLGADEIIMCGFDLALKEGRYHCKSMSTPYYDDNPDAFSLIDVEGVDGKMIKTELALYFHLKHFEHIISKLDCRVVDSSEGGARIKGTELLSLRDSLSAGRVESRPEIKSNERFNSFGRADFFQSLSADLGNLKVEIEKNIMSACDAGKAVKRMFRDEGHIFELVSLCSSALVISKLASRGAHDRENAIELLKELDESVDFLRELIVAADYSGGSAVLLLSDGLFEARKYLAGSGRDLVEAMPGTPLPLLWKCIRENKVGTIIAKDGEVIPDVWTVTGIRCVDMKTCLERQYYERSLWCPGYMATASNMNISGKWRKILPGDIDCRRLEDII
jgi:hypothetical protein